MKIHQLALSCALMLASSCTKDDFVDVNEAPAKEPLHAISSTTTTINSSYTDESSFVSSLASHGFETPATLHLNQIGRAHV